MKKSLLILGMLAVSIANAQQGKVGVNTDKPKATLDIEAFKKDGSQKEGLLIPRLSREAIKAMGTDVTESTLVYVNALGGTQDGTVEGVDSTGFYYYIAGTTNKWVKQSIEPWKVYGTDKLATENNQNIYQKGNVVATPLDIPTSFLDMGETSDEVTAWGMKSKFSGFKTYGEDMALNGTFFAKHFGDLSGSHLKLRSRGKNNGEV